MIIVTLKDMLEFIFAQPNRKWVRFGQSYMDEKCGCVMIQYARHKNINCYRVGSKAFYDEKSETVARLTDDIRYDMFMPHYICTYKQIKVMLKEKFPEETKEFAV